ncbi:hypothetical protein ASZ90_002791 [hydrocarbon metagenome]|uniref:Uncharacterized protein n=1 Tax=hydrocarbon metagenome TaxID=938273 RepID=A0A0W8G2E1_9ZZZZ
MSRHDSSFLFTSHGPPGAEGSPRGRVMKKCPGSTLSSSTRFCQPAQGAS